MVEIVFCGTPRFAVPTLEALVRAGFPVRLVVTQPDKPRGRGLVLTPSPVKQSALSLSLPVTQPDSIKNNGEFRSQLASINPGNAIIVVGYGRIIPQWMIDLPRLGNINLHASLLPKYRGAAPIQWAIARGETTTGVTTMRINAGLDTGDILLQQEMPIDATETAEALAPAQAEIGAYLIVETMSGLEAGTIEALQHDDAQSNPCRQTFSKKKMAESTFDFPPKRFAIACAASSPGRESSLLFAARTCMCGMHRRLSVHLFRENFSPRLIVCISDAELVRWRFWKCNWRARNAWPHAISSMGTDHKPERS